MLDAGADVAIVQQLMEHAHAATTVGYDRRPETARQRTAELIRVPYRQREPTRSLDDGDAPP